MQNQDERKPQGKARSAKSATGVAALWLKWKNRKPMNRALATLLSVVVLLGISAVLAFYILASANDFLGFSQESKEVQIVVEESDTLSTVVHELKKTGVVTQGFNFEVYAKLKKLDEKLQPGTYTLDARMSYDELIYALRSGEERDDIVKISFPEGMSVHEIADELEENNVCSAKAFLDAVQNDDLSGYDFIPQVEEGSLRYLRLEGYVFPDTYYFFVGENPSAVLKKFLDAFDKRVTDEMRQQIEDMGLTLDEAITMASIIQKEASDVQEMADVASVFYNRLNNSSKFPKLQSDVTINYVESDIKPYLEISNQEMYDAYNTYECSGLPVGPVCNPGVDAINAVLYPSSTNYYFFISDKDGKYYYASTLAEHERNIDEAGLEGSHGTNTQK